MHATAVGPGPEGKPTPAQTAVFWTCNSNLTLHENVGSERDPSRNAVGHLPDGGNPGEAVHRRNATNSDPERAARVR